MIVYVGAIVQPRSRLPRPRVVSGYLKRGVCVALKIVLNVDADRAEHVDSAEPGEKNIVRKKKVFSEMRV